MIVAFLVSWTLLGLGMLPAPRGTGQPLFVSAAVVMAITWLPSVAVAVWAVPHEHKRITALVGLLATVLTYFVVGAFWWFRI